MNGLVIESVEQVLIAFRVDKHDMRHAIHHLGHAPPSGLDWFTEHLAGLGHVFHHSHHDTLLAQSIQHRRFRLCQFRDPFGLGHLLLHLRRHRCGFTQNLRLGT